MTEDLNDIASKTLGSANSYAVYTDKFDPTLINPMPRAMAREGWGITGQEFVGYDVWNCHEATFLLDNGLPVAGTLKYIYPAHSEFMIESKSAKLYMNSFDMCKMGKTYQEAKQNYENQIKEDLSKYLQTDVQVAFFNSQEYRPVDSFYNQHNFLDLAALPNLENEIFDDYNGSEKHLVWEEGGATQLLFTNILRSRCRHTKQKDTGAAYFILNNSDKKVNMRSLLKEIVALREVNEFHEFCCEKLFCELNKESKETTVALLYSRRGSLDINPIRATSLDLIKDQPLLDINVCNVKVQGQ